ncbi:MAG: hypothetical protein HRT90_04420 [Candidatus Margulisbacteria bacterium]|nr:hypothetical protein [Candidatus Margulisiibacteriota bacterium]
MNRHFKIVAVAKKLPNDTDITKLVEEFIDIFDTPDKHLHHYKPKIDTLL